MTNSQVRRFKAGEVIFREGESGNCAYLIESGRIIIYIEEAGAEIPLRNLGEGEVLGEMALIDATPRSASCRALTDAKLIVVTKDQLIDRVQAADPVVRLLMRVLLERLRSHSDRIRGRAAQLSSHSVDPFANEKKEALARIGLESKLRQALDNDEFVPFYQPIYDLHDGTIRGCEALIRWVSTEQEVVATSEFMDVIEDSSLILRAGEMILEKCAVDLKDLRAKFGANGAFFVSVNVSGRQFADEGFLPHLEATRKKFDLDAKEIKLELTERVMAEGPQALNSLEHCRKLGYQLAIDDFGTGFSSLQYLARMPLTDLKIDRSFVVAMDSDPKSLSIIKSLIYMAELLGLQLIAEGIETEAQLKSLKGMGVQLGQGYLFSRAIPLNEFMKLSLTSKV